MSNDLYGTVMHGTDDDVDRVVYRRGEMSGNATRICTGIVTHHFRAPSADATVTEIDEIPSGEFSLRVLNRSWASDETPLIVHDPSGTVAGIMMPFNDLTPLLVPEEAESIAELSAEWIARKVTPK